MLPFWIQVTVLYLLALVGVYSWNRVFGWERRAVMVPVMCVSWFWTVLWRTDRKCRVKPTSGTCDVRALLFVPPFCSSHRPQLLTEGVWASEMVETGWRDRAVEMGKSKWELILKTTDTKHQHSVGEDPRGAVWKVTQGRFPPVCDSCKISPEEAFSV